MVSFTGGTNVATKIITKIISAKKANGGILLEPLLSILSHHLLLLTTHILETYIYKSIAISYFLPTLELFIRYELVPLPLYHMFSFIAYSIPRHS
jgi:hypothetical protein